MLSTKMILTKRTWPKNVLLIQNAVASLIWLQQQQGLSSQFFLALLEVLESKLQPTYSPN